MNTPEPTSAPVSAARMFPAYRARAEAELLRVFNDMGLREVAWYTHDETREYPVEAGKLAFIPCTFVFDEREDPGYTVFIYSETLKDRWRTIPLFYLKDQLQPELISRLAVQDLAPLFQAQARPADEALPEDHPKDSLLMLRIVALTPLVATIGFAISYFYTGEVIFDIRRWRRDPPAEIIHRPIDLILFFTGWCLLSWCALVWVFRDVPQKKSSRLVWWTGYGGAGLIALGFWMANYRKYF